MDNERDPNNYYSPRYNSNNTHNNYINNYNNYNNSNNSNNNNNNNNNNNYCYQNEYNNKYSYKNNNNKKYENDYSHDRRYSRRSYSPYRYSNYRNNNYNNDRYRKSNNNNFSYDYNKAKVPWDDENGFFLPKIGEYIISRYKIKSIVGMGTFSTVVECWDSYTRHDVAIKIVRSVRKYSEDAMIEIDVLNSLEKNGFSRLENDRETRCVKLLDWFRFKDHVCLVFKKYGISLYDFLKQNKYRPLPLSDIQIISHQLLTAIKTIHSISLVHTDLKPENILLDGCNSRPYQFYNNRVVPTQLIQHLKDENNTYDYNFIDHNNSNNNNNNNNNNTNNTNNSINSMNTNGNAIDNYFHLENEDLNIVVIDFGGATFESEHHTTIVCSRPYRPPEIILGMGWSYPADLWGLGCILLELYVGATLFDTYNNKQHLLMMEKVCGPLPISMSDQIKTGNNVNTNSKLEWPEKHDELNKISRLKKLCDYVHPDHGTFLDLIKRLLEYHPTKRISALDALNHPFFNEKIENDLERAA